MDIEEGKLKLRTLPWAEANAANGRDGMGVPFRAHLEGLEAHLEAHLEGLEGFQGLEGLEGL